MKTTITVMALLALSIGRLFAGEALSARSTYLGNGWFQYDVTLHHDPYFKTASLEGVVVDFTNCTEFGDDPLDWSNAYDQAHAAWAYSTNAPTQTRPYSVSFLVHSTNTTFKANPMGLILAGSLVPQDHLVSSFLAENMVYLCKFNTLIPCRPEDADGSATSIYASAEMVPDVRVDSLYMISNEPYGLTFSWPTSCTVQIQAQTNFSNWIPVTNALGYPPSTTWTSPVPLQAYGNHFRIRLLATEHRPDLL